MKDDKPAQQRKEPRPKRRPYVTPTVHTYSLEELADQIGPAMACSPAPCPVTPDLSPMYWDPNDPPSR